MNRIIDNRTGSFEVWLEVVREIVGVPMKGLSLLDLCCNECSVTAQLGCDPHVGVDLVDWPTRPKRVRFIKTDAFAACEDALYEEGQPHDICICSDGLEHMVPSHGRMLLAVMPKVAKLAIIFTPLGPYMLDPDSTHPDAHKSAWWPEELEGMGWTTQVYPNWHLGLGIGAFFAHKGALI